MIRHVVGAHRKIDMVKGHSDQRKRAPKPCSQVLTMDRPVLGFATNHDHVRNDHLV